MTDITPSETIVPCKDIARVQMRGERMTLDRAPHQTAFAAFGNWAQHQARHLCERGSCSHGTCRGHVDVSDWRVLEQDGDRFTCEFSAEFFCRCH